MTKNLFILAATALAASVSAQSQTVVPAPPKPLSAAERAAASAREEEALSRPASWDEMSLAELEKSVGGRTLLEVKLQGASLEDLAALIQAQTRLNVITQSQIMPASQRPQHRKPPTFSFDVSRRPFWDAVRAMSLAQTARHPENDQMQAPQPSMFNDLSMGSSQLFPSMEMLRFPVGISVAPGFVVKSNPYLNPSFKKLLEMASPEQKASIIEQGEAPHFSTTSPRSAGAVWSLFSDSFFNSGSLSLGRAHSSWPCLFVTEYIGRKQDGYLAADTAEATAAKPQDAPKPGEKAQEPQALEPWEEKVTPGEWRQKVALQLRAYIDPRVRQYRNVRLIVDEAKDEAGHDLRRADFAKPRRVRLERGVALDLPIALDLGREHGDKLHLRGALLFWVPSRTSTTEFALDAEGKAARQAIFFGQTAALQLKLSQSENKSWMLSSQAQMKGEAGQLDFRRELAPALNDDRGYRAGLILPGNVRLQSANGCEWKLSPFSEQQQLTLNAGQNVVSYKTDYISAFRSTRTENGSYEGNAGPEGFGYSATGDLASSQPTDGKPNGGITLDAVPPDGFSYTENVTWQLQPTGDADACGTGEAQPAISKIFFDTPQGWRQVRVPFEFRDLPLPPR